MSVMHICDSSYFMWSGTLHQVHWLRCLPLDEYHNELIREQMPTDQKMKCEQWTLLFCLASLSQSLSHSNLRDSRLAASNRLVCRFYQRLSSVHACGLKVADELESSGRFFMLHLAVPALGHGGYVAAASTLR